MVGFPDEAFAELANQDPGIAEWIFFFFGFVFVFSLFFFLTDVKHLSSSQTLIAGQNWLY